MLPTRGHVAGWRGRCGDAREALRLLAELLPDQTLVLGSDHPDMLPTRDQIKRLRGGAGEDES